MNVARFDKTSCSQCGGEFGPGDQGYSHCEDHLAAQSPAVPTEAELLGMVEDYGQWLWDAGYFDSPTGEALVDDAAHRREQIRLALRKQVDYAYAEGRKDEREELGASGLGGGVRSSPLSGSIPESSTTWQPIETAPEDENILVATTGGWVDTAFWTDEGDGPKWWWLVSANEYAKHPLHPNLVPTHWMPLPKHPEAA